MERAENREYENTKARQASPVVLLYYVYLKSNM